MSCEIIQLSWFLGVALPVLGVVAFLDKWNEQLSTSAGYAMVKITNSDAELPPAAHQSRYALANTSKPALAPDCGRNHGWLIAVWKTPKLQ
jgi:hypothetical protein